MKVKKILTDQSGVALVVALIIMVILTLIGLGSIFTSTFEIKLSGNKRGSTDAFYTADGGAQAVIAKLENFTSSGTPVRYVNVNVDDLPNRLKTEPIDKQYVSPNLPLPSGVQFSDQPKVTIYHTTETGVPRGSGLSAINFNFEHYLVESVGKDQIELNPIKSTCIIQEKVVRLLPTLQGGY